MRTLGPVALGLAMLALAGCDVPLPGEGVRSFAMLDGAVNVRGPDGYCVDPEASNAATGFAVLGACGLVAATGIMPSTDGFITVQAGTAGSAAVAGSEPALAALLRSPQGAALLSDTGRSDTIRVDQMDQGDGLVSVHFTDSAPPQIDGLEPDEWRAFLDINGRLTTISVRGYARAPLTSGQAQNLLYRTVEQMRAVNRRATTVENG